ncbi:ABC transporter ATP-binding protein [Peptacetobacter hiranonis]|uniref:ABC transporter, ATP-binding protein n=1 Tax=Peptacetobacter hiranonis (strain DSM 13275 / JCM 10541 / KCTC 15199 / TO-931) TaxID=500633 RepID=B6G1C4_PEPHT|nr:ABC transporter ATP-binding protein [Peptacetobacter hiranonis]EEA84390.1 ABC transporter, ATP-binding protein [Peptacetobacter hiranonis DSM 13275]QEK21484.1 Choline transport ATP-binding protein OpuBA [Peptacetobacter hiranonis]
MLNIEGVSKTFENFSLNNINIRLEPGKIMGIIGDNGSGKTSIINLIMGLYKPSSGKIELNGNNVEKDPVGYKNDIGFVYDNLSFYPNLKLRDYKKIVSMFYKNFDEEVYDMYFDNFNLDPEEKIKNLSKGQCEKVMISTALSHHAKLLILDEPIYGLEKSVRKELIRIFKDYIKKENGSVVISTHNVSELEEIYDHIVYLEKGKILFNLKKKDIVRDFRVIRSDSETLSLMKDNIIGIDHYKRYSEALVNIGESEEIRALLRSADYHKIKNPDIEDLIHYYQEGGGVNA